MQDLNLLGVGADEVEDLVVRRGGVLEERRERGDRFPAAGGGVDEEDPAPFGDLRDLREDAVLPRPYAVGEQVGRLGGRGGTRRKPGSTVLSPRSGF
ncbi:MAG: hypothetical protein L3J92_02075 [Thermoplasmata archaeon]|nr:hypothetical protein [Thermoplasmata archaeon]